MRSRAEAKEAGVTVLGHLLEKVTLGYGNDTSPPTRGQT